MPIILCYQYLNFWNPYIYHIYFAYNFNCLCPLFIFFKFIGSRALVFINGTRINVNNNNNNSNNNNNNNNRNNTTNNDNSSNGTDNDIIILIIIIIIIMIIIIIIIMMMMELL